MSKICPKCNKEWPDEFMACPLDGSPLVAKPQQSAGTSLNLGDANAISGGITMSDNHSVNNNTVNNTTSNVDSHNVITNNITQVKHEKSESELKHERELAFREACLKVYSNGIMTSDDKRKLEDLQYHLGVEDSVAAKIMSDVAKRSERKSTLLSPVHQITFNNIKKAILSNRLDMVNRLMAQMKAMVQRYSAEEIQYTYYMLLAVLHPTDCITEFENHKEDKYWQSFWSSVAYRRMGNIEKSELLLADVGDKWVDTIPQDNVWILASINALLDEDTETAKSLYDNIIGEHSPLLSNLVSCLYTLLYSDILESEDLKKMQEDGLFYANNLFTKSENNISIEASKLETESLSKESHAETNEVVPLNQSKGSKIQDTGDMAQNIYNQAILLTGKEKFNLLLKAAELGHAPAQFAVSDAYSEGGEAYGCQKDIFKAVEWLKKACESDYPTALVALASIYLKLTGDTLFDAAFERDYSQAESLLKRAAEKDNIDGIKCLMYLYDGRMLDTDPVRLDEVFHLAQRGAALHYDTDCQLMLGYCYLNENIVEAVDEKQAAHWFQLAANSGNSEAMNNLGNLYSNSSVLGIDQAKSFEWYEKAAKENNPDGMWNLACAYSNGTGCKKNNKKAELWLQKAAQLGQLDAQTLINERESMSQKEEQTAEQLLEKALAIDGKEQIPLLDEACKKGSSEAMFRFALRYLKGDWVEKDEKKAFSYMSSAAKLNHVKAMANLGVMYKRGLGTKASEAKAIEWLQKAADNNDEQAKTLLATWGVKPKQSNPKKK